MTSAERSALARRWLPHVVAAIVLAALLVWDRQVYAAIAGFRSPFLTWLTERVSQLRGATFPAAVGLLLIVVGLIGRRGRLPRAGTAVMLTVPLARAVTTVMQEVIARPGAAVDDVTQPSGS